MEETRRTKSIPNFIGSIYGMDFLAADTGYIVGAAGVIFKTIDGGNTWLTEVSGTFNELRSSIISSTVLLVLLPVQMVQFLNGLPLPLA